MVDRVYKSLFVYTVGFYELLNDATKTAKSERL
jgi:hypothetical protein